MDILKKFTVRSLKLNKKRTIVTIIGIILSTSLICGVVGLVSSTQQTLVDMVKRNVGNFHVRFSGVPSEELKYIENNVNVKESFLTNIKGFAYLKGSKNPDKPYLAVLEYDDKALNNNGIKLIEGRLPENDNELLISEQIRKNARVEYNIGDVVTIDVGKRVTSNNEFLTDNTNYSKGVIESLTDTVSKTYTIVGIMERPDYSLEKYSAAGYTVITCMENLTEKADISILYKSLKNYSKYNKQINPDKKYEVYVNQELIRYQGGISDNALRSILYIAGVVMFIIVFTSIFVIRNSFSISVAEKNRQYGMLSSIGATKKQIKATVILEGFIIGIIAIPIGIICGILGIVLLLEIVNYLLKDALGDFRFVYNLPLIPMFIAVIISFLTIYLSCLIPARRASKVSPIEAIRGNNEIKLRAKKLKTPRYINKLFGIGGVIASKNLKRCRRKYATTIVSIVVSIVIFISMSSFIYYGNKTSAVYYKEIGYNIMVDNNSSDAGLYNKISKLDNIQDFAYYYIGMANIEDKYCTEFGKEMLEGFEEEDKRIAVYIYNNDAFKKYIKEIGASESEYDKGAVLIDDFTVTKAEGNKEINNIYSVKSGDNMNIGLSKDDITDIKILKKTDKRPMGLEGAESASGILIVSEDFVKDLNEYSLGSMFVNSNDADKLENAINDLVKSDINYADVTVRNYDKYVENENRMVLVISIFLYGFITVITLIGVTNIFNTITTNMILRSKEFAMLKSIGMTNKEFNNMIMLESILYGLKSLIIGIPIGIVGSYLMYKSFAYTVDPGYIFPIEAVIISIVFVFGIVGATMRYSLSKINKQNIIDTIRNDNI